MIYHITSGSAWDDAKRRGTYRAPSLENEGFIHCSTRDQLLGVANAFYRGREDLALLCIDQTKAPRRTALGSACASDSGNGGQP